VDATGRGSRAPNWLDSLGFEKPEEIVVDAHWGYASRLLRMPENWDPGYLAIGGVPQIGRSGPWGTRGAGFWRQDGGRWILTLMGAGGDHPPGDEAGFLDFAKSLPYRDIADALEAAEEKSAIVISRTMKNRMRRYEALSVMPDGFVAVGDAVAAFNPIHGQGMTTGGMGALVLRDELERQAGQESGGLRLEGFSAHFQESLAESNAFPWMMSTMMDYQIEGYEGPPVPEDFQAMRGFFARLEVLAGMEDPDVHLQLLKTIQLVEDPSWMQAPELQQRIAADWDRLGSLAGLA
jgi:hypothetical protein